MSTERGDQRHQHCLRTIRIAATLLDGPRTYDEILHRFYGYLRPLGLFKKAGGPARNRMAFVNERIEEARELGWIVREGDRYALTNPGREVVNGRLAQLGETGASIRAFLQPRTAARTAVAVHWGLAASKLPAGLLSGSVGLLNDATDTLLDGLSSLLVYYGIRSGGERAANGVLVILMLATGLLTLSVAGRRLFVPFELEADWFAFLAAIFSAGVCLLLWAYQRYVGRRSGIMALITQSVDSRNHVVVAMSVTAGLVASQLRFPLLDTLVGLAVALLILKSALELAVEQVRSLGGEETDFSHFPFWIDTVYVNFLHTQLRDWLLYLVETEGIHTRFELVARARQALDFQGIPAVRALGLEQEQPSDELIEGSLAELFQRGWLTGEMRVSITDAGRKHLDRWV
ncbi:MAG: hypothetical protein APR53_00165 [Methanoculleus sp. SDB]|nr:MAG: hypothetical protein APR53_00165 [Methanoculleus sp. SDB]